MKDLKNWMIDNSVSNIIVTLFDNNVTITTQQIASNIKGALSVFENGCSYPFTDPLNEIVNHDS